MILNIDIKTIRVSDVIFREDLYPRIETSATIVQKYAEDLSVLPPIEVNELSELIDGWYRWTAHRKKAVEMIEVVVTPTMPPEDPRELNAEDRAEAEEERHKSSDAKLLELAIERNAQHGHQLSTQDKKRIARNIYRAANADDRGAKKQRLARLLSMSYETINRWLSRIDKDTIEERNAAVQDLYLQCYTQEEIGSAVGMPRQTVDDLLLEICKCRIPAIPGLFAEDLPDDSSLEKVKREAEAVRGEKIVISNLANAEHNTDFEVPLYNIWKQQKKTVGSEHFGNSEIRLVDNLLYLYTKPFDVVVDPFAGGGSTLDICKKRFRRCYLSDRNPIDERKKEIRKLDLVVDGLPDLRKRWSEVRLVYLDPPYWIHAAGEYSNDPTDLANMSLDQFTETLAGIIIGFAKKLTNARIALLIQPTQWKAPEKQFTDHVGDMLRAVKLPVDMRFSVPYESQQYTPQMVDWAKDNKSCLVLTREIVVWRVA